MIKLKVAAVAFATGMMTIAVYAQDQMPENPKSLAEKASKKQKEKSETAGKPGVDKATTSSISVAERTDLISSARKEMTGSIGESETYRFGPIVRRYAASYGVPVSLANAVISVESNYQPNTTGSAGEDRLDADQARDGSRPRIYRFASGSLTIRTQTSVGA